MKVLATNLELPHTNSLGFHVVAERTDDLLSHMEALGSLNVMWTYFVGIPLCVF